MRIDKSSRRIATLGIFLAYVLVMGVIERMISLDGIVPGMRLGFANLAVVISLYLFKTGDTLLLVLLKCVITSMLSGSVLAFFYSAAGSFAGIAVMRTLLNVKAVSPVGISVAGAAFHNIGQIMVARVIFGTWAVLVHLPLLLLAGTVSGVLVGILAKSILPHLRAYLQTGGDFST